MAIKDGNFYVPLTRDESLGLMAQASKKIEQLDVPDEVLGTMMDRLHGAIEARELDDMAVDTRKREEVTGIVLAAMAEYDHLVKVSKQLNAYVVGLVNTRNEWIL